jgi:3-isopropylmalate dehydratase small subunit
VDPETHARLFALVGANPEARLTVDLAEQGVLLPDGSTLDFEIDPFAKRMLLAGTDEIGYVVAKLPEVKAWEAAHPARVDTRIGAPPAAGGRGGASWPRTVHPIDAVSETS